MCCTLFLVAKKLITLVLARMLSRLEPLSRAIKGLLRGKTPLVHPNF